MVYCNSTDGLFALIAPSLTIPIDEITLLSSDEAKNAVRLAVDIDILPRLIVKRTDTGQVLNGDVYATRPIEISALNLRHSRAHQIDNRSYDFLIFEAILSGFLGLFLRSRRYELPLSMQAIITCHAWIRLSPNLKAVDEAEVTRIDVKGIESPDPADRLTISLGR